MNTMVSNSAMLHRSVKHEEKQLENDRHGM